MSDGKEWDVTLSIFVPLTSIRDLTTEEYQLLAEIVRSAAVDAGADFLRSLDRHPAIGAGYVMMPDGRIFCVMPEHTHGAGFQVYHVGSQGVHADFLAAMFAEHNQEYGKKGNCDV